MSLRIPISTYRLQFNSKFGFRDATKLVPYLNDLGITDIYASPLLQAKHGSEHGYDVTDPSRLNAELGTDEDFDALAAELKRHDMGLLLDIVPNHMSASSENPWWMDVLENGQRSRFAAYFDVDWHPPSRPLENRVLLPVLAKPYAEVLESGGLNLAYEAGAFFINYFDFKLPVNPRSYAQILEYHADLLSAYPGIDQASLQDFQSLLAILQQITAGSSASQLDPRQIHDIKDRLSRLYAKSSAVKQFVDENIASFNGQAGAAESFGLLDRLLARQVFALAFWQTPNQGINYRRFFTISELVGVRVGDPIAFDASHNLVLRLASKGLVTGFRIDHIDGLRDPLRYLERLQERLAGPEPPEDRPSFYVVLEKILSGHEQLSADWPAHGTTGYDFLNYLNGLFIDERGISDLDKSYRTFVSARISYDDLVYLKKKQVMATMLSVEARSLEHYLGLLALQDRYARDIPREKLARAIVATTACLSVYRTYVHGFEISPSDREVIERALREAQQRDPEVGDAAFAWLRELLLMGSPVQVPPEQRQARLDYVMNWQQLTGSITAKAVEDSALYLYNSLVSANEVGATASAPSVSPAHLHEFLIERQKDWPFSMNATMTHDTKHSEDFRARVNVLSEMPEKWNTALRSWSAMNSALRVQVDRHAVPDPNEEVLLYQTLLGSWLGSRSPDAAYVKRIQDFMIKAGREAMIYTRWTVPNVAHESALIDFVASVLDPAKSDAFLTDFSHFAETIAFHGALNSLSQLVVKVGSPGVPDFYQGSELWDLRLVDPDNRQPIDFELRHSFVKAIQSHPDEIAASLSSWKDGGLKLRVMRAALACRKKYAELFLNGKFHPVAVRGLHAESVFAFARSLGNLWALIVVPRITSRVSRAPAMPLGSKAWKDTQLVVPADAPTNWKDVIGEKACSAVRDDDTNVMLAADVFHSLPVGMLIAEK